MKKVQKVPHYITQCPVRHKKATSARSDHSPRLSFIFLFSLCYIIDAYVLSMTLFRHYAHCFHDLPCRHNGIMLKAAYIPGVRLVMQVIPYFVPCALIQIILNQNDTVKRILNAIDNRMNLKDLVLPALDCIL